MSVSKCINEELKHPICKTLHTGSKPYKKELSKYTVPYFRVEFINSKA